MISVVVSTHRPQFIDTIIENFSRQTLVEKELILILNTWDIDLLRIRKKLAIRGVRADIFLLPPHISLGECLNQGVKRASYSTIAKFDDDDYYGKYYLEEAQHVLSETGAEVIGKRSFFIYFKNTNELRLYHPGYENIWIPNHGMAAYKNTYFFSGATLVTKKSIAETFPFPNTNIGEDSWFQKNCFLNGIRMYAASRKNYAYLRYPSRYHHTSNSSDSLLKKNSDWVANTLALSHYVDQTVPQY
ncbi:glycosyltransferase [Sporolactobacillus shoreae]|uniref:glycosyltransferase n=1 Tax=Sporolactobacillus shoreae TaxID=1465501 RepID=UPI001432FE5C|nr:glycosyltransferase [Sporolactobacillus shoreae]